MSKLQNIKKFFALFGILIFAFCIFTFTAEAAQLNFVSRAQEITVDQQFQVDLLLDTENEEINAIEGRVLFPENLLEVKEIRDGNSVINFWIEKPKSTSGGRIAFSGIVPGGYNDSQGLIFSVAFLTKKEGDGAIEFSGVKALRNDGQGTLANLSISNFQFSIAEKDSAVSLIVETVKDADPPEEFTPQIAADPVIFEGKWFLVFATQDKGSGIDRYEVREGNRSFVIAESPYLLQNQDLDEKIIVKAIDKSGNERIATLPSQKPLPWYKNYTIFAILIIIGLFVAMIILRKLLWQKFIKSR